MDLPASLRSDLEAAVESGTERAFVDELLAQLFEPSYERNRYYPFKEYLFLKLMDELRLVQGASLRTANLTRQYVDIARRCLPSLESKNVLEIGPGRSLGAGLLFRYLGATYSGVEIYPGDDFNTWSTLASTEALARTLYGSFEENFNGLTRGFLPAGDLRDRVDMDGISLVQPEQLSGLPLSDESVDFAYSNFTLEHIQKPAELARELARVLRPGGVTAHFIDIEDHANFAEPFNYLVHSDDEWDAQYGEGEGKRPWWLYENRARASDFRRDFEAAGFEIIEYEIKASKPVAPELYEQFHPRFKAYDLEDLQIVWLMLVARKLA